MRSAFQSAGFDDWISSNLACFGLRVNCRNGNFPLEIAMPAVEADANAFANRYFHEEIAVLPLAGGHKKGHPEGERMAVKGSSGGKSIQGSYVFVLSLKEQAKSNIY